MYNEIKYFKEKNTFERCDLSNAFIVQLLKWSKDISLKKDKDISRALEVFKWCYENHQNGYEYLPREIRSGILGKMSDATGYTEVELSKMYNEFNNTFINNTIKKTKIIAIEGIDGTGKTVQTERLVNYLEELNKKVKLLSFPEYNSFFGVEVGKLLSGKYELSADKMDSKSMSLWYALDRYSAINKVCFDDYDFIIFNRYTLSNAVYQSIRDIEGNNISEWVLNLEHFELGLPIPDLYLVLDMDIEKSQNNISKKGERSYLDDSKDVYEKSQGLLEKARARYIEMSKEYLNIEIINCSKLDGNLEEIDTISKKILEVIEKWNLLNMIL